jgi:hypothetical protein
VELDVVPRPKTPRDDVLAFLKGLQQQLEPDRQIELYVGGGAAILLAYDGKLSTVDVDFIGQKSGLLLELNKQLGKGSEIHRRTKLYFDVVPPG